MSVLEGLRGQGAVYFLRHGQTDGHAPGLMKGLGAQPLSDQGRIQARQAGAWLVGKGITRILSSPLARAVQTAGIIAEQLSLPDVSSSPLLTELDTGVFTGLTPEEAARRYPEVYAAFLRRSWDGVPGAETSDSLFARAIAMWRDVGALTAQGHQTILCVVHKGIFQWIMHAPFDCAGWMPLFELDFCGIYRLSYDTSADKRYFIWDLANAVPGDGESG